MPLFGPIHLWPEPAHDRQPLPRLELCRSESSGARVMFSRLVLSSADGLSGQLDVGSHQTSLGPVGLASGAAPPAFHQTKKIGAFDHSYNLNGTDPNHETLQIDATKLNSTA